MAFIAEGRELLPGLVSLRRALHRNPEVGLDLPWTQERVLSELDGLGLELTTGRTLSSVTAVLRGAREGPAVLLRGDMDALPLVEENALDYAAANGAMHACGHDLHVAGLVGAARLLAARRAELAGSVVFMFQPGEEGAGGARLMIEEGVLDAAGQRPVAAYGIHVVPGPRGVFFTRPGTVMAGDNHLRIAVVGSGGHSSQPHNTVDPVPALVEIAAALPIMVSRKFSVFDPVILSVTQLEAAEAVNIIPDTARLGASIRTLSSGAVERLITETRTLAAGIAAAHGCRAEVDFEILYPVTENDPFRTVQAITELREVFGAERVVEAGEPVMGSEDFSLVLEQVPGTFFFLGTTPPGIDPATVAGNHSPRVIFDDAVLGDQAAALAQLAFNRLSGPG